MSDSENHAADRSCFEDHETDSKIRYTKMQKKLIECAESGDEAGLRFLATQLDAQLRLEDFLLKFRESEHAWLKAWAPIFTSAIVSIVVVVLAHFLSHPHC